MKKNIFTKQTKDNTVPVHYTIRGSLVAKVLEDSKKYNMSASKIVEAILNEYYNGTPDEENE